jgi:hypothetical protein
VLSPAIEGFMDWMATPFPTWEDVAWLAELWHGPLMVKGIPQPDDARRAVDAGATAIGVSNHGGNNLDTTPSPLRYLPSAVDAVGDQAEITFDSGIRRGADVVKVLALGAKAALVGRSWFFGECLVQVVSIDAVVPQVAACAVLAGDSWTPLVGRPVPPALTRPVRGTASPRRSRRSCCR